MWVAWVPCNGLAPSLESVFLPLWQGLNNPHNPWLGKRSIYTPWSNSVLHVSCVKRGDTLTGLRGFLQIRQMHLCLTAVTSQENLFLFSRSCQLRANRTCHAIGSIFLFCSPSVLLPSGLCQWSTCFICRRHSPEIYNTVVERGRKSRCLQISVFEERLRLFYKCRDEVYSSADGLGEQSHAKFRGVRKCKQALKSDVEPLM